MGKKYLIKVNGKMYEVEVEEMGNASANQPVVSTTAQQPATPPSSVSAPESKPIQKSEPVSSTKSQGDGAAEQSGTLEKVVAPMSGVVLKVNVHPGDVVKDAQTLIIIEAMKMENEILAPRDGKIKEVFVKEGQQIEIDQVLLTLE